MSDQSQIKAYYDEYIALLELVVVTSDRDKKHSLLLECHDLLQSMSIEARLFNGDLKIEWMERIKNFKTQLQAQQQEADRAELGVGGMASTNLMNNDMQRRRLRENDDMLARQNATLEQARRTIQETEDVGMEVCSHLQENRSKIEASHSNVRELSSLTGRAGELIKSMSKPFWR